MNDSDKVKTYIWYWGLDTSSWIFY